MLKNEILVSYFIVPHNGTICIENMSDNGPRWLKYIGYDLADALEIHRAQQLQDVQRVAYIKIDY